MNDCRILYTDVIAVFLSPGLSLRTDICLPLPVASEHFSRQPLEPFAIVWALCYVMLPINISLVYHRHEPIYHALC